MSDQPKEIEWTGAIPPCQICTSVPVKGVEPEPGIYDVPTTLGPWADICEGHLPEFGANIAIGYKRVLKVVGEGV